MTSECSLPYQKMKMETLFQLAGINYQEMTCGTSVDISDKNIWIKSYDISKEEVVKRKLLSLIRKEDSPYYFLVEELATERSFKASPHHKLWVNKGYFSVESLSEEFIANINGEYKPCRKVKVDESTPILDIEVEDTHNYFANGILSKNSTPGGHAVKFYSSWRARVSKMEDIADKKEVIGNTIKLRNAKSKIGFPKRLAQLELYYATGFNPDQEYVDFIIKLGLVKIGGAWISNDEWNLKVQGREKLLDWLKANPDKFNECKEIVNKSFTTTTVLDSFIDDDDDESFSDDDGSGE